MAQPKISPKTISISFAVLVLVFLVGFYIFAWQEPTSPPPGGNVPAPLNVGSGAQTKTGALTVDDHFTAGGLTVRDNFTASIGAADFKLGYSGRHGSLGRAIVDLGNDLRFNYAGDWQKASIGSNLDIYGDISAIDSLCLDDGCKWRWDQVSYWTQSGNNLYPNDTGWNVGIGVTNPSEKLQVAGNIDFTNNEAKRMRLENSPTPPVTCDANHMGYIYFDTNQGVTGKTCVCMKDGSWSCGLMLPGEEGDKLVFVTNGTYRGRLSGHYDLNGVDQKCRDAAQDACDSGYSYMCGRTFKA